MNTFLIYSKMIRMNRKKTNRIPHGKKILSLLFSASFLFAALTPVQAIEPGDTPSDGRYHLVDFETGNSDIEAFDTYEEAAARFSELEGDYVNLGIVKDAVTLKAEYAMAYLKTTEACDYNVTYTNAIDGASREINGCAGKDAAYLTTNDDGTEAEFMISGAKAWASIDNVTIVPLQNVTTRLTMYLVEGGKLYHEIKSQMDDDNYAVIIDQGTAPDFLEEGEAYYSFDGHYFYSDDSLYAMLDDLRNNVHEAAVNAGNPWYDYYQYVSHRTLTNASYQDMESYLTGTMDVQGQIDFYSDNEKDGINDTLTRSQYYGNIVSFWQYQYEYGANALMMLAISQDESGSGRSALSYTRNNLFSHAAYDNDAEANASRFTTLANSVYSHARYYISGAYCSPLKDQFHGSFFGNLSSGMNVSYSSDPYWGEKTAAYYRRLDEALGANDKNTYTLGIRTEEGETKVYQYPDGIGVLYITGTSPDFAFVILGEISNDSGDWYVVQSEATMDQDSKVDLSYNYDYANDVGYIRQDAIQIILQGTKEGQDSYSTVTFNADGGTFAGNETEVRYQIANGMNAACAAPTKDHALFIGWDSSTDSITEDKTFTAQYKEVSSIELSSMPQTEYELNDRICLQKGTVTVHFQDGTEEVTPLTTSMISGFDMTAAGDQEVTVTYAGCSISYSISVSAEKDEKRAEIKQEILDAISTYSSYEIITDEDADRIIALKEEIDRNMQPYLTQNELRAFDSIAYKAFQGHVRYVVDANEFGLGVSGLCISVPLGDSLTKKRFWKDTYRVRISKGISEEAEASMVRAAVSLGNDENDSFTITLLKNLKDYDTDGPLIFSIDKPSDAEDGDVYTVLYYNPEDDDVEECYTRQSANKITFMANADGEFLLTSRRTSNNYLSEDASETVTHETSSYDMEWTLIRASLAFGAALIFLLILWRILKALRKSKLKKEQMHREEEKKSEKPLEVTQAIEILNTEMMNLEEIRKAEEEQKKKEEEEEQKKKRFTSRRRL